MNRDNGKLRLVVVDQIKKPRRKTAPFYKKKLDKLSPGQITRINIYNWRAECSKPPRLYINRIYKGDYQVIEEDEKGFTVLCLQKRERYT